MIKNNYSFPASVPLNYTQDHIDQLAELAKQEFRTTDKYEGGEFVSCDEPMPYIITL
jgi:hypothetical protein